MSDSRQFKLLMNDQQGADINHPQLRLLFLRRSGCQRQGLGKLLRFSCTF